MLHSASRPLLCLSGIQTERQSIESRNKTHSDKKSLTSHRIHPTLTDW